MYIIAHRHTAESLIAEGGHQEVLIATSNWQVEQVIRRAGGQVIQIEDLLTLDQQTHADCFIHSCIRGWYIHESLDFTEVDGLSLGFVHEYELLHLQTYPTEAFTAPQGVTPFVKAVAQFRRLVELSKPSLIRHDITEKAPGAALSLVASHFDIRLETLPDRHEQAAPPEKTRTSVMKFLRRRVGGAKLAVIRLLRRWRDQARRGTTVFLIEYPSFQKLTERLMQRGYRISSPADLRLAIASGQTKLRHQGVRAQWQKIKSSLVYRERFVFLGIDCFPYFDTILSEVVGKGFVQTLDQAKALREYYARHRIQAVVVPFDEPNFARLCVLTAQRLCIPTVACQHGVSPYGIGSDELMTSNHLCVISEYDASEMRRIRPNVSIDVIGCVQLDRLVAQLGHHQRRSETHKERPLRLLILTAQSHTYSTRSLTTDTERYLLGIVEALNPLATQVEVTFKLHPSEKRVRYELDMELLKPAFAYTLETGWRLPDLLPQCDLMISPVSTGVVEALFLRKPVVHFRPSLQIVPQQFDDGGCIPTVKNAEGLHNVVLTAARDYPRFLSQYDFETPLTALGPHDGKATDRLAASISRVVEREIS